MASTHSNFTTNAATSPYRRDFLLYDGGCPVCDNLVAWTHLRKMRPEIELIDARQAPELVAEFRAKGIEINDTMVLQLGGVDFSGPEAFLLLARIAQPRHEWLGVLLKWLGRIGVYGPLYPLLVKGRKLLLFLLRRSLI
jgi:predicted DCC family thiol-disulfide oxidoreductase YuxK